MGQHDSPSLVIDHSLSPSYRGLSGCSITSICSRRPPPLPGSGRRQLPPYCEEGSVDEEVYPARSKPNELSSGAKQHAEVAPKVTLHQAVGKVNLCCRKDTRGSGAGSSGNGTLPSGTESPAPNPRTGVSSSGRRRRSTSDSGSARWKPFAGQSSLPDPYYSLHFTVRGKAAAQCGSPVETTRESAWNLR